MDRLNISETLRAMHIDPTKVKPPRWRKPEPGEPTWRCADGTDICQDQLPSFLKDRPHKRLRRKQRRGLEGLIVEFDAFLDDLDNHEVQGGPAEPTHLWTDPKGYVFYIGPPVPATDRGSAQVAESAPESCPACGLGVRELLGPVNANFFSPGGYEYGTKHKVCRSCYTRWEKAQENR